ncbi:MAG: hypothetical protein LQ351_000876 [Letrouitia transgressa]|nr:MAG: hypothetical protein LQ351_000876 [Letrouitia transgressa]
MVTGLSLDVKDRGKKGGYAITAPSLRFSMREAAGRVWGSIHACHGEGCASLVEPTDHDPGLVLPGEQGAAVTESPSDIPGDEAEPEDPEDEEAGVVGEVEFGMEGAEVVERAAGGKGG